LKSQFEHITFPKGCSVRVYHRQVPSIPFEWHYHPEYELTLTLNSRGWRFIADHIGQYESQDLVLVPSDMPHTWASTSALDGSRPHVALVVWFTRTWALQLADVCPEFAGLRRLLKRATPGLNFLQPAGARMEARLPQLLSDSPHQRLQAALETLSELAEAEATPLATQITVRPEASNDSAQLTRVLNLLHKRFAEPIRVEDLCSAGNLSPRSLHRLFVHHVGENVSDYLGRLRIGRACMLLVETDRPVSVIASEAGFSNLSNFNRRFLEARGMTPRDFRRFVVQYGRMPDSQPEVELNKRSPSLETRAKRLNTKTDFTPGSMPPSLFVAGTRRGLDRS
jgi:AraC-like DNA-binding protein